MTSQRLYDLSKKEISPSSTASAQEDQSMPRCGLPPQDILLVKSSLISTVSAAAGAASYDMYSDGRWR